MRKTLNSTIYRSSIYVLLISLILPMPGSYSVWAQGTTVPDADEVGRLVAAAAINDWEPCVGVMATVEGCGAARKTLLGQMADVIKRKQRSELEKSPLGRALVTQYDKIRTFNQIEKAFQACEKAGMKSDDFDLYQQILAAGQSVSDENFAKVCGGEENILRNENALNQLLQDVSKRIAPDETDYDLAIALNDEAMKVMARNYIDTLMRYDDGPNCNRQPGANEVALMLADAAKAAAKDRAVATLLSNSARQHMQFVQAALTDKQGVFARGYECYSYDQAKEEINGLLDGVNNKLALVTFKKNHIPSQVPLIGGAIDSFVQPEASEEEKAREADYLLEFSKAASLGAGTLLMTHYFQEQKPKVAYPRQHKMESKYSVDSKLMSFTDDNGTYFWPHEKVTKDDVKNAIASRKASIRSRIGHLYSQRQKLETAMANLASPKADEGGRSTERAAIRKAMDDMVFENPVAAGHYLMSNPTDAIRYCHYVADKERDIKEAKDFYKRVDGAITASGFVSIAGLGLTLLSSVGAKAFAASALRQRTIARGLSNLSRSTLKVVGSTSAVLTAAGAVEAIIGYDGVQFWEELRSDLLSTASSGGSESEKMVEEYHEAIAGLQDQMVKFKAAVAFAAIDGADALIALKSLSAAEKVTFLRQWKDNLRPLANTDLQSFLKSRVNPKYLLPFNFKIGYVPQQVAADFMQALTAHGTRMSPQDLDRMFAVFAQISDADYKKMPELMKEFVSLANDPNRTLAFADLEKIFKAKGIDLANAEETFTQSLGALKSAPSTTETDSVKRTLESLRTTDGKTVTYIQLDDGQIVLDPAANALGAHPIDDLGRTLQRVVASDGNGKAVQIRVREKVDGGFVLDDTDAAGNVVYLDSELASKFNKLPPTERDALITRLNQCATSAK